MATQYSWPSDNKAPSATISLSSGTAVAGFEEENVADLNPAKPLKTTGTSASILFTFGGSQTVQAIVIIGHNLAGATVQLTNGGGMATQAIAIAANHEDGHSVGAWKDISAVASNASTTWTLAISGAAANIIIGEVLLLQTWRTFQYSVDWGVVDRDVHPVIQHRTFGGVRHRYDIGVKYRQLEGSIRATDAGRAALLSLARDARGTYHNWPFVLDSTVNDARYVHFMDENIESTLDFLDDNPTPISLEEESQGLV